MASSNTPTSPSAPIPTFLTQDPYPSQSRDGRPQSAASVATDATSEYGTEDFRSAKERHSNMTNLTGLTGPVGEPGLPPSRPMSAGTSVVSQNTAGAGKRDSLQPPPSRRGGGASSRPGSSVSKTHVPTLTAQGFWRPMSSSKLQAQRNRDTLQATGGAAQTGGSSVGRASSEATSQLSRRYSNASLNTLRDAKAASIKGGKSKENEEEMPPLPVSRGTQFTNEATVASEGSATPLRSRTNQPSTLQVNGLRSSNTPSDRTPRSPRSLRASLGMGSRNSRQDRPSPKHHEKLDSNPSSPQYMEKPSVYPTHQHQHQQPRPSTGKNYEYFAGNMLFFLSGRCMNTRARPLNVLTFILTVLPAALFFAFSAPWLWHHLSPAIPIIFAYIFYLTLSAFLHAALSDPGILPRNLQPHPPNPEEERDALVLGPATTEWVMVKTFPASSKSPLPNGRANATPEAGGASNTQAMEVPTKFCKSCNIWRPPRAHHCRVCDACIETQDHHCVWLNNCVGRRNYRFFFSYVAFGTLLAFLLLAFSLTHVGLYAKRNDLSFSASLTGRTEERVAFAMFIYALVALPYPGSLFGYHLFLLARGETTREYLNSHKFLKKDRHRPFSQPGLLRNWKSVLLRPRPPTYLQFKHSYMPGDVRLGHTVPKKQRKEELGKRYSTTGPGAGAGTRGSAGFRGGANGKDNARGNGNGTAGMEMKNLPPLPPPPPDSSSTMAPPIQSQVKPPAGNEAVAGTGVVDRTPR